jgi:hypothetical protein
MVVDYSKKVKRIFLLRYNYPSYLFGVWHPGCDTMFTDNALLSLIEKLEQDCSLDEPRQLPRRVEALDDLDAYLADGELTGIALHRRAAAIHAKLESVNSRVYESIRRDIQSWADVGCSSGCVTGIVRRTSWIPEAMTIWMN